MCLLELEPLSWGKANEKPSFLKQAAQFAGNSIDLKNLYNSRDLQILGFISYDKFCFLQQFISWWLHKISQNLKSNTKFARNKVCEHYQDASNFQAIEKNIL